MHVVTHRLILYSRSYCRLKFYIVRIGILDLFHSCDLGLVDPMTFIYKLDYYSFKIIIIKRRRRRKFITHTY